MSGQCFLVYIRHLPRAPLPTQGVTSCDEVSKNLVRERYLSFIAHTGSCARPNVSFQLGFNLAQKVFAGCYESLLRGLKPQSVKLTSKWWTGWQRDYGLSMRKANRKYKVPKAVMGERLEIGWLNCARVRALCLATNGYDPEMENWDQSPFHHNESGSCGMSTLAVAGTTVPLIEGHADTRARWTANLVTWSNKQRFRD